MRKPKQLPAGAKETLRRALQRAKSKAEFQRIQCLWLRAALGLSSEQVATAVGWRPTSVRRVQSLYLRQGGVVFEGVGRGGRRRQNLTGEQERQLREPFVSRASQGACWSSARSRPPTSGRLATACRNQRSIACWLAMDGASWSPGLAIRKAISSAGRPSKKTFHHRGP